MSDNDANAQNLYRTAGPDWLVEKAAPAYTEALLALLRNHIQPGQRVLDICCGYGRLTIPLLKSGCDVTGVDISDELIAKGRFLCTQQEVSPERLLSGNMKALQFPDQTFDLCFCVWASFNFLVTPEEQAQALREMHRVLRPNGTALIECPLHDLPGGVQRIDVSKASYLYRSVTQDEMTTLGRGSPFARSEASVVPLAGRNRLVWRLMR